MALLLPQVVSSQSCWSMISLQSDFLPSSSLWKSYACETKKTCRLKSLSLNISCAAVKLVRDPLLDKHVVKQNKIRFVRKLITLLLSKPKHYMPIQVLEKCRGYLAIHKPRSLFTMIHRYPTIFELFRLPLPRTPFNATGPLSQLCVRLTPAATALANEDLKLKSAMSTSLATKLQKLLMLSSHRRLLLSKLVHLAPDLGLPPNFRSRLCNDHPDKFKTVDTSYGRALELVSWDLQLANPLPAPEVKPRGLIVDRPLKFRHLKLRKGLNIKRHHQEFLLKFSDITDVCPYKTSVDELVKESIRAEKRACDVVREVLGMMVEKRTLIDHLTHFRKEFGLPNKLRAMLVRHPELFYVSLKGLRDSVFLVEGYDDEGKLLENDKTMMTKFRLMRLVREGKRMNRERKRGGISNGVSCADDEVDRSDDDLDENDDYMNSLDDLFESDGSGAESDDDEDVAIGELLQVSEEAEFWSAAEAASSLSRADGQYMEPW